MTKLAINSARAANGANNSFFKKLLHALAPKMPMPIGAIVL